jgi:hypothetical protein
MILKPVIKQLAWCPLKVLSSEMDPAGIRFIRKAFIKERGTEVFRKIHPSLIH